MILPKSAVKKRPAWWVRPRRRWRRKVDRHDAAMGGVLAQNVLHFARLLRRTGLPVGPADMLAAQEALSQIDLASRAQVQTALRTTMVHRHEHQELFDQAFILFWRDPEVDRAAAALQILEGAKQKPKPDRTPPGGRRLADALAAPKPDRPPPPEPPKFDAVLTVSATERLQTMDFEA